MKLQKFRWSKVYESSEEELLIFLQSRQITAERWAADAFQAIEQRQFGQDRTLWCAEGSLKLSTGGAITSVQPGDAVRIPANTSCDLTAGMSGCVCYDSL